MAARPATKASLNDVVREPQLEARNRTPINEQASPMVSEPDPLFPDYVEHHSGVTEIGQLSAKAAAREYEAAMKEIGSMGGELMERAKQCEGMIRDALAVTIELNEVAARYRAEAKLVFEHIEGCSAVAAEARSICSDLKDKISASSPAKK